LDSANREVPDDFKEATMSQSIVRTARAQRPTLWGTTLFHDVDRFFNDMLTDSLRDGSVTGDALATRAWAPPVDVRETNEHVILTAELPGLEPEDVEVTLQDQILSISGQRTLEKAAEGENVRRVERSYGSFRRSFAVPPHLAADKIDAKFDKGVLTLTLPKAEVAKPRRIEIK
jgi:HSP20 family protein